MCVCTFISMCECVCVYVCTCVPFSSTVVREQGKPHRSKPYRFRTFNGSYVTLETEWLCFVNPWTKRIDSIIGQHRVLKVRLISGHLEAIVRSQLGHIKKINKKVDV